MEFAKENLNLENALNKEWLITNGIGGYASSTIIGANTRKYLESQDPSTETLEKIKSCTKALDDIPFKLVMSRKEELSDLLEKLSDKIGEILDACR